MRHSPQTSATAILIALASIACTAPQPAAPAPAQPLAYAAEAPRVAETPAPVPAAPAKPADPLPTWNDGPTKDAIRSFVSRVTTAGGPDFVPMSERIAVFDNDGTLWSEQPLYIQLAFALDRVRELSPQHPEWKTKEPFKSVLAGDLKAALAGGEKAIADIVSATHTGTTTDEFREIAARWFASAKHPKYGRPYAECVYQPMLEVLAYLRANGFKTFIVSGGGVEFMRAITERIYGIPPEQVIGSMGNTRFELREGKPVLVRDPGIAFVDDGPGKPVGIHRHIGRRPIAAFGNSDGDQQMLEWTASGPGPRLAVLVHHTDAAREVAYDRASHIGKLDKALDEAQAKGWTVASMKDDWKAIFPAPAGP
jgi:phosphoglycolate phosphatase-like HAD superfamily hydrolase